MDVLEQNNMALIEGQVEGSIALEPPAITFANIRVEAELTAQLLAETTPGSWVGLVARLLEQTTRPERVYRHRWQVGDLVMWDNRCVLHRGRPWDSARHKRVMHRTTVAGDGPTANPAYLS